MKLYGIAPIGDDQIKPERIEALRLRWQRLRVYRYRGSFPVAYRILRNYIRIELKQEQLHEA
jgi:hypothetical protein